MRIGVNAHLLPHGATYRSAGVATYERELVERLPKLAPQHEFIFFVPPGRRRVGFIPSILPTYNPLARIVWEQFFAPFETARRTIDVFHSPVNISPLLLRPRSIVTVHDLAYLRFPDRFSRSKHRYLKTMVKASLKQAEAVIVPSARTKRDLLDTYGLKESKLHVIAEGIGAQFRVDRTSARPVEAPYILYVGTIEPRKNLPLLINAFAEIKKEGYPHYLALVGPRGWLYEDVDATIRQCGLEPWVRMPGFVEDLVPWYNHADLFVYPSIYEGFGLPPLEAMACGTPVIVSSGGSLREVAGEAALLVDPDLVPPLHKAIRRILDDEPLRVQLVDAGLRRSGIFSWDECVKKTLEVYESVDLSEKGGRCKSYDA